MPNIQRYDAPNYTIVREKTAKIIAAASDFVHFNFFQKCRVNAVHALVLVAGTNTNTPVGGSIEISLFGPGGTTSFANFEITTNTAMKIYTATVTRTVAANNGVRFAKGTDVALSAAVYLEYEVLPDAAQS